MTCIDSKPTAPDYLKPAVTCSDVSLLIPFWLVWVSPTRLPTHHTYESIVTSPGMKGAP